MNISCHSFRLIRSDCLLRCSCCSLISSTVNETNFEDLMINYYKLTTIVQSQKKGLGLNLMHTNEGIDIHNDILKLTHGIYKLHHCHTHEHTLNITERLSQLTHSATQTHKHVNRRLRTQVFFSP